MGQKGLFQSEHENICTSIQIAASLWCTASFEALLELILSSTSCAFSVSNELNSFELKMKNSAAAFIISNSTCAFFSSIEQLFCLYCLLSCVCVLTCLQKTPKFKFRCDFDQPCRKQIKHFLFSFVPALSFLLALAFRSIALLWRSWALWFFSHKHKPQTVLCALPFFVHKGQTQDFLCIVWFGLLWFVCFVCFFFFFSNLVPEHHCF